MLHVCYTYVTAAESAIPPPHKHTVSGPSVPVEQVERVPVERVDVHAFGIFTVDRY